MAFYTTYGEFQKQMKEYYLRTGNRMQFPEMTNYMYQKGLLSETPPKSWDAKELFHDMTDDEFNEIIDTLPLELTPKLV